MITNQQTRVRIKAMAGGITCAGEIRGTCASPPNRKLAVVLLVINFCQASSLVAHQLGARDPEKVVVKSDGRAERNEQPDDNDNKPQRRTPLGTQVPVERALKEGRPTTSSESVSSTIQRVATANGNAMLSRLDMMAEGTVTIYTASGSIAFSVTLIQNGEHGSQRILLKQPDGKLWDGRVDHLAPGACQALVFLETQYRRGLQQLLNSPKRDAQTADNGIKDASRVVTVLEKSGESTKYLLDSATSRMARFEFVRGLSRDSDGNVSPIVHSYGFADFRTADSVVTPFHIEHSVDGVKQEELQLTKVRYDTAAISVPAVRSTGR